MIAALAAVMCVGLAQAGPQVEKWNSAQSGTIGVQTELASLGNPPANDVTYVAMPYVNKAATITAIAEGSAASPYVLAVAAGTESCENSIGICASFTKNMANHPATASTTAQVLGGNSDVIELITSVNTTPMKNTGESSCQVPGGNSDVIIPQQVSASLAGM